MRSNTVYVRRDPFAEFDALVRRSFGPQVVTRRTEGFAPAAEAHRDGDDAVIRLDLPGVDVAKDVTVEVTGHQLVISGERRDEHTEESGPRSLKEFRYGSFRRAFRLAPSVTGEDVTAAYDNGVLTVRVAGAYAEPQGHKVAISTAAPAQVQAPAQSETESDQDEPGQADGEQADA